MEKQVKDNESTAYEMYRRECLAALGENERIKLEVHALQKQLHGTYKRIKELSDWITRKHPLEMVGLNQLLSMM